MKPTRQDEPATLERPIPDAYWIIPGRLLAGPYPGSRRESTVRQRVLRFLAGGTTLFLDLTEEGEMPPYAQWLDEAVRHLRVPIPDFGVPTPEQMVQTLDVIDVSIGTRHAVYVHCLAGLGRTGTAVGCFMVRHGMQGAEALRTIQLLRHATPDGDSPSPVTDEQWRMVLAWKNGQ
jgi:hypothetical protein